MAKIIPRLIAIFFGCWVLGLVLPGLEARADTIYLKGGEVRTTVVERYSDGAFWVRDGNRTIILRPEEILKIVFVEASEFVAKAKPVAATSRRVPEKHPASSAALLTVPAAVASSERSPADTPPPETDGQLVILNYRAMMNTGIFQVVGGVENRMKSEARYVKITVTLLDEKDHPIDQNFSYVQPGPPHLRAGETKQFRVSFIQPPDGVAKYKIRVESSPF